MNREALQTYDQLAATYLQQLQALAFEINAAMDAVGANALARFEESVAKQEMLCASLVTMANAVGNDFRSSEQLLPSRLDAALELEIRVKSGAIRNLNLQYAALLKHSGRSITLLASLCRSHTGQSQEARWPRLKHQTWSCEM